jgi:acyl transferase domain-containing protein
MAVMWICIAVAILSIQTSCSTSLVVVCLVAQSLLERSCDMALAGLIKAAMVVDSGEIPPNNQFSVAAPGIDFAGSPFFVNSDLHHWQANGVPRRVGASSFGAGGTNAHVLLEESPRQGISGPSRNHQLLVMPARNEAVLERLTHAYARRMLICKPTEFADIAHRTRSFREGGGIVQTYPP